MTKHALKIMLQSMFGHFSTLCNKGLKSIPLRSIYNLLQFPVCLFVLSFYSKMGIGFSSCGSSHICYNKYKVRV